MDDYPVVPLVDDEEVIAAQPRFVETVPSQGNRFAADVEFSA